MGRAVYLFDSELGIKISLRASPYEEKVQVILSGNDEITMREYTSSEIAALMAALLEAAKRARQGEGVSGTVLPEHWKTSVENGQILVTLDGALPDGSPSRASRIWTPDAADKVVEALQRAAEASRSQCQDDDR
jgi:hypothetical protein